VGRVLPTADDGYPVAQLGGQLSGGEIARPDVAGPIAAGRQPAFDRRTAVLRTITVMRSETCSTFGDHSAVVRADLASSNES
jgi:hypothetical protein